MGHNEEFGLGQGHDIELIPSYAYGLRTWTFRRQGPEMRGAYGKEWIPGVNTAVCEKGSGAHKEDAPALSCTCGYYGYWSSHAERILEETEVSQCVCSACIKIFKVAGVIRISGHVIMGTAGFRAQKAEIIAVSLPPFLSNLEERIERYADYVGIPTGTLKTIWGVADEDDERECCTLEDTKLWLKDTFKVPIMNSIGEMLREFPVDAPEL